MVRELETITVQGDSELARVLEKAAQRPVMLEKDGVRYRVAREDAAAGEREDIWKGYDPQKVRQAIEEYGGSWADIDAEAFKAFIYRAREEGSRPPDRPRWPEDQRHPPDQP